MRHKKIFLFISIIGCLSFACIVDNPVGNYRTAFSNNCFKYEIQCDTIINTLLLNSDSSFLAVYNQIDTTVGKWKSFRVTRKIMIHFLSSSRYPADSLFVSESKDFSIKDSIKKLFFVDLDGNPLNEIRIACSHDSVGFSDAKPQNGELTFHATTLNPINIEILSFGMYSGHFKYKIMNNSNNVFIFKIRRHRKELFLNEMWIYDKGKLYPEGYERFDSEDYYLVKKK